MSLLLCVLVLVSCGKNDCAEKKIEIRLTEVTEKDGTVIQIPEFRSDNEEVRKNLRDLEKETNALKKMVEREQKKGTHMEMRSYLSEEEGYPQVTVVWYLSEEDTRIYDLITLGADEKEGIPITCKEALEKTGMTGVDLSLRVGRLAQESGIRGELTATEMQGFHIDSSGQVSEIYMKLYLKTTEKVHNEDLEEEEIEKEEEHFFSFYPEENRLVKMSELGFDIP